jgi:hypothetical protein
MVLFSYRNDRRVTNFMANTHEQLKKDIVKPVTIVMHPVGGR